MSTKVELRMNEEYKIKLLKNLLKNENGTKKETVPNSGVLVTVNRLILKYKTDGKNAFIHGNRGRLPSTAIPLDTKNKIISLYLNDYSNANFTHFCEIIQTEVLGLN